MSKQKYPFTHLANILSKSKSLNNLSRIEDIKELLNILLEIEAKHPQTVINALIYEVMSKYGNVYEYLENNESK